MISRESILDSTNYQGMCKLCYRQLILGEEPRDQHRELHNPKKPPSIPPFQVSDEELAWRIALDVGDEVDAKNWQNHWFNANIKQIAPNGMVFVHYHGYTAKNDTWFHRTSPSLAQSGTKYQRTHTVQDRGDRVSPVYYGGGLRGLAGQAYGGIRPLTTQNPRNDINVNVRVYPIEKLTLEEQKWRKALRVGDMIDSLDEQVSQGY